MLAEVTSKYANEHYIVERMEKKQTNKQTVAETDCKPWEAIARETSPKAWNSSYKTRQSQNRKFKQLKKRA